METSHQMLCVDPVNELTDCLIDSAFENYRSGKFNLAVNDYNKALTIVKSEIGDVSKSSIYILLGHIYKDQGQFQLAEKFYSKSLLIGEKYKNTELIAWAKSSLALIFQENFNFSISKDLLLESIRIFQALHEDHHVAQRIFDLFYTEHLSGESIFEHNFPLEFPKHSIAKNNWIKAFYFMIIALQQENLYNWTLAELYWEKALDLNLRFTYQLICHESLIRISLYKFKINNIKDNLDKLTFRIDVLETLCLSNDLSSTLLRIYHVRAQLDKILGNYNQALDWLQKCNQIINSKNLNFYSINIQEEINSVYQTSIQNTFHELKSNSIAFQQLYETIKKSNSLIEFLVTEPNQKTRELTFASKVGLSQKLQQQKIITILETNPLGISQKNLPALTGFSQSTISRRIQELEKQHLIKRIPDGKSIIIILSTNS